VVSLSEIAGLQDRLTLFRFSTANIRIIPDLSGLNILNYSMGQLQGMPVLTLRSTPMQGLNRVIKALEDKLISGLIVLLISPFLLTIALAVKLSSPGPIFYRQERVSLNNKTFQMLKFRSMPVDAESATGAVWAKAGENRATKVGAFLRKTSLDELPQFLNVLRGEMSIVGPRPERPVLIEQFKQDIPGYMQKHMVKAGITGWAQVNGWRGNTDLKKRIEYDLYYIEHWSLWFDLKIIFLTIFKGFVNKNAY
jgi:putative colanic acid biosynthesis UDP-glucose lipid carrier transferase